MGNAPGRNTEAVMPCVPSPEVERVRHSPSAWSTWRSPHQFAVDCFVTCGWCPARPESGKLSMLGRPDMNKLVAEQLRSAAMIPVINAGELGRVGGKRRKVEARYRCPPEPGDGLRRSHADGSGRSSADRRRTARLRTREGNHRPRCLRRRSPGEGSWPRAVRPP